MTLGFLLKLIQLLDGFKKRIYGLWRPGSVAPHLIIGETQNVTIVGDPLVMLFRLESTLYRTSEYMYEDVG